MRVLVTGASGFVGGALIRRLLAEPGHEVVGAYRHLPALATANLNVVQVGDLGPDTDWQEALVGVSVVVHCAARVHVMNDDSADPLAAYRQSNVAGTLGLARAAAAAGCKRFVFLSSVKVNGEFSLPGQPLNETTPPQPIDPYGVSKLEAEQGLLALAASTGMAVVVIRPPLVYGPGVKANFAALLGLMARGLPLPLGAVTENRRSFVAIDNLVDLITLCLDHPAAANQIFFAADGEDLSTRGLLLKMAAAVGVPARLLHVPVGLIRLGARLLGKGAIAQRLCDSLQVDITKAKTLLGWQPPVSVDEGLRRVARGIV